jgi:transcriptional regulator with XRE-family HTH domain
MELLKAARAGAGLSQRELAQRAGTSQAMVARIERGQQSPSLATLERLVRACGLELRVEAGGEAPPPSGEAEARSGRLLVWRSGEAAYAFPLEAVERIAELGSLRRLPGQALGAGVAVVDGEAIAAIDAARWLGIDGGTPAEIVVVRAGGERRGVLVDRAETLAGETSIVPLPPGAGAAPFVSGLAEVEGEQVVVLDPDGLPG